MKKKIKPGLVTCEKYSVMNCKYYSLNNSRGLSREHWCKACRDNEIKRENKLKLEANRG